MEERQVIAVEQAITQCIGEGFARGIDLQWRDWVVRDVRNYGHALAGTLARRPDDQDAGQLHVPQLEERAGQRIVSRAWQGVESAVPSGINVALEQCQMRLQHKCMVLGSFRGSHHRRCRLAAERPRRRVEEVADTLLVLAAQVQFTNQSGKRAWLDSDGLSLWHEGQVAVTVEYLGFQVAFVQAALPCLRRLEILQGAFQQWLRGHFQRRLRRGH